MFCHIKMVDGCFINWISLKQPQLFPGLHKSLTAHQIAEKCMYV